MKVETVIQEDTCGCVFDHFGNYFLAECERHAKERAEAEEKEQATDIEDRILAVVKASAKPIKASAIAERLEVSAADVVRSIRGMEEDGRIKATIIRGWLHYSAK